jgi:two-component system, chemotaxis family, response regulator Rcp1
VVEICYAYDAAQRAPPHRQWFPLSSTEEIVISQSDKEITILVVENNDADKFLMVEGFKAAGLTSGLFYVKDGEDALMYVRNEGKYEGHKAPDLIFLDLSLPAISGLDVLREIKSTPQLMHIPIVVSSGSDDPELVRAVYALNGNCFIRKPNELGQFLRFIEMCYEFWGSIVTLSPKPRHPSLSQHDQSAGSGVVAPGKTPVV